MFKGEGFHQDWEIAEVRKSQRARPVRFLWRLTLSVFSTAGMLPPPQEDIQPAGGKLEKLVAIYCEVQFSTSIGTSLGYHSPAVLVYSQFFSVASNSVVSDHHLL